MLRTTFGIVIGAMLSFALFAQDLAKSATPEGVCDANVRTANLDFTLKDINGKSVDLNTHKGKVILLDFWATWCPPCKKEIPGFIELYKTYSERGFVVLGVSMDDSIKDVQKFAKQFKMNYPVLVGYEREDIRKAYAPMPGFPTTFIIGRDGKICSSHTGFTALEQFERKIKTLL